MADFFRELARITGQIIGLGIKAAGITASNTFFSFPAAARPHNNATNLWQKYRFQNLQTA